ncbi:MAG: HAD family hydrolase [Deltaproteobacteria bacterium]|nr:HAD family hydrolase [Deltaproteobacteria bacterium]MBW1927597.1 HAD family hydrolase [Deltaproteobacteria bacterium]MBW2024614.1 HAD family hydrolase [Deltaproteobacteria bacterium]MBW2125687.1 HAD family hydrolase [Deltaproteobacteria bacterium]RLB19019.1 MAG: HAD family hydrolase [Deltaproteobacteria bacterium]
MKKGLTSPPIRDKIRAVIFDCDGVMFDSKKANISYYNHLLKRFGLPPMNETQIEYVHMHTADESVAHLFKGTPYLKEAQDYRQEMDYMPFVREMVMEPGLKEVLSILKANFRLAVATNRSNTIEKVLEIHGISHFFDMVVSSLDVTKPKPHPEAIQKILQQFALAPQEAVYVGDSAVDQQTAEAAGVIFIAYGNKKLKADYHAVRLMDIPQILGLG